MEDSWREFIDGYEVGVFLVLSYFFYLGKGGFIFYFLGFFCGFNDRMFYRIVLLRLLLLLIYFGEIEVKLNCGVLFGCFYGRREFRIWGICVFIEKKGGCM